MIQIQTFKGACIAGLFLILCSCTKGPGADTEPYFTKVKDAFTIQLDSCIHSLNQISGSRDHDKIKHFYLKSRMYFKRLEPVLSFVDVENYKTLNQPNILQVEEEDKTNIRIREPQGFQVLEEFIFTENPNFQEIQSKVSFTKNRLSLIKANIDLSHYQPYHFLWLLRNSIINVAFSGITGFDSPVLLNSIKDAKIVYSSLKDYVKIFESKFEDPGLADEWKKEFLRTTQTLTGNFEEFDRYAFIKERTHSQIDLWNKTVKDWKVEFPFSLSINNHTSSLFSDSTFNLNYLTGKNSASINHESIRLGEKLFNDSSLSGNGKMSCSTCHQKELAFTDGLRKSRGNKGQELLRNSPTLLYAGLQTGFFYDKRAGNLEGQVLGVALDKNEFHTDMVSLISQLKDKPEYINEFSSVYTDTITDANVRNAIAIYIRSLAPFNSKFDKNISGLENTMNQNEIDGFNLFMGKAACATCHFPPVFNGTVPPRYLESELESLGVPKTAENKEIDTDPGRYSLFKTEERKFFFKTPTIRNIELTAPYMHNGVYDSLEQVIDFYNKGGGIGLGFDVPHQTLPFDSLSLSVDEQQAIIAFMRSLTDN